MTICRVGSHQASGSLPDPWSVVLRWFFREASWPYAGCCPALTGRLKILSVIIQTFMEPAAAVALLHGFFPDECVFVFHGASRFPVRNDVPSLRVSV